MSFWTVIKVDSFLYENKNHCFKGFEMIYLGQVNLFSQSQERAPVRQISKPEKDISSHIKKYPIL